MTGRRTVLVVGAGAAGIVAAVFAARAGAAVVLIERTADGGRKILISGGGRCNVLPARLDEALFVTDSSPNSLRKILRAWPLVRQREWFERELGIPLVEEPGSGGGAKLFPRSGKAREVRDALLAAAKGAGVSFAFGEEVREVAAVENGWEVRTAAHAWRGDAVVVATGGLSVPATGSDGFGLRMARRLGHLVHDPYPALAPVLAPWGRAARGANGRAEAVGSPDPVVSPFADLSGLSLVATVRAEDATAGRRATSTGGFLFTHDGYSGPSVLDVSHVLARASRPASGRKDVDSPGKRTGVDVSLTAAWTEFDADAWTRRLTDASAGRRGVVSVLAAELPARLASALLDVARVSRDRVLATLRREERVRLVESLTRCPLPWSGEAGYAKAEVTGGGVALSEVDPRTLESRRAPGLHFCGELLDAFGPIGGYNFAWAWATGRSAGIGAAGAM